MANDQDAAVVQRLTQLMRVGVPYDQVGPFFHHEDFPNLQSAYM